MEEEAWRGNLGGGILEEESRMRNIWEGDIKDGSQGGGIVEEESWRRNPGRGIKDEEYLREEESWRRNQEGGIKEGDLEHLGA